MKPICFSFQASGHKFRALEDDPDGPVFRLFCPSCGRVIPANQDYNLAAWSNVELPPYVEAEVGNQREPIH